MYIFLIVVIKSFCFFIGSGIVSEVGDTVMASTGTVGSVSISLHPLVILNISEHWTRQRAQESRAVQG